jgi:hypothetical protein
MPFQLL